MRTPFHLLPKTLSNPNLRHNSTSTSPSPRVSSIINDLSALTLLELADLTQTLRTQLHLPQIPLVAVLTPGMPAAGFPSTPSSAGAAAAAAESKPEKTAFDLKLESFEAASKIKIIKEVRSFTDLGLKEAKDLVEKAPALIKKGVMKDEAERIVEKMRVAGAKVVME